MTIYDDIYERGQMMSEVYHDILYQYLLSHYVAGHFHDGEKMNEWIPMRLDLVVWFCLNVTNFLLLDYLYDVDWLLLQEKPRHIYCDEFVLKDAGRLMLNLEKKLADTKNELSI